MPDYIKIGSIHPDITSPFLKDVIDETVAFANDIIIGTPVGCPGPVTIYFSYDAVEKEKEDGTLALLNGIENVMWYDPTLWEPSWAGPDSGMFPTPFYIKQASIKFSSEFFDVWNYNHESHRHGTRTAHIWNNKFRGVWPVREFVRETILHEIMHCIFQPILFNGGDLKWPLDHQGLPSPESIWKTWGTKSLLRWDKVGQRFFVGPKTMEVWEKLFEDFPEVQERIRGLGVPLDWRGVHFWGDCVWYDGQICIPGVSSPAPFRNSSRFHPLMQAWQPFQTSKPQVFTQLEKAVLQDVGFEVDDTFVEDFKIDTSLISWCCGCDDFKSHRKPTNFLTHESPISNLSAGNGSRALTTSCEGKTTPKMKLAGINRKLWINDKGAKEGLPVPSDILDISPFEGFAQPDDSTLSARPSEGDVNFTCYFCLGVSLFRNNRKTGEYVKIDEEYSYRHTDGKLYKGKNSPFVFDVGEIKRPPIFVEFPERDTSYYYPKEGDELVFKYEWVPCNEDY